MVDYSGACELSSYLFTHGMMQMPINVFLFPKFGLRAVLKKMTPKLGNGLSSQDKISAVSSVESPKFLEWGTNVGEVVLKNSFVCTDRKKISQEYLVFA